MSRRALLSAEQRNRLFAVPTDPAEMARHYVIGDGDLTLIRSKRRGMNRLGFAVQLCLLRYPGQGLGPGDQPLEAMIAFVAGQVGVPHAAFADYAHRDQTRREHAAELQAALGLRRFGFADWRKCIRVGADAAWATDRGEPIVRAMLDPLRAAGVLVPAATVLERIGLIARVRARKSAFEALTAGLTDADRERIDALLVNDPDVRRSRFAWLRDLPESPAPSNMVQLLDRLEYVRELGVGVDRARRVHPVRLGRLVEEAAIMSAQHITDLEPVRRTAILVAQITEMETKLADATLAMFEKYMGSLFTKARGKDERRFSAAKRDVAKALLLFRRTIFTLKQAKATGEEGVSAIEREIGMARLERALPVIESVAHVAEQDILVTAAEKYAVLRRFTPRFLDAFRFQSSTPNDPMLAAVELLRATGNRGFARRPPAAFLPPRWRKLIFASGKADRRLYEVAVLATLRDRLRGSDIWVAGTRDYRAFEDYLLPVTDAADVDGIGGEANPDRYIAARAALLDDRLRFISARAATGDLDGVEIEDGKLFIARTKPTAPEAARPLAARLESLLPRVRITEVLADVDAWTRFSDHFTHLRTGSPAADKPALLAAVLADGTNLGLSRMADASRGLTYHHLVNVAQWHINDDNYVAARAAIINAHHRHPLAALWGDGTTLLLRRPVFSCGRPRERRP